MKLCILMHNQEFYIQKKSREKKEVEKLQEMDSLELYVYTNFNCAASCREEERRQ